MSGRTPIIAGNWKMFKTCDEAVESARDLVKLVNDVKNTDIMIAPPFTALAQVSEVIKGSIVASGAQNIHWEKEGAYTGEISADMISSAGSEYVIIGHSERRQYFGETDDLVNKKIAAAISSDLIPIMCIGESEKERESNKTFSVLDKQIKNGLKGFDSDVLGSLVIAYEPIWAIGTGKTATSKQAQEVHKFIRSQLETDFGAGFASSIRILYGGSVKPSNISELMSMPDLDGALVGGASLDPVSFSKIVNYPLPPSV
ncbi:Triosephosphate isomerase [Candidatus Magnetomoraceae bacterium gMMP-15]